MLEQLENLKKTLEAGGLNAAPGSLTQGSALQNIQDLGEVMNITTFGDDKIILQKMFSVKPCKSTLVRFRRQLSYGRLGGSAVLEGFSGQETTPEFTQHVVPMSYYAKTKRVTLQSTLVDTFDGIQSPERMAEAAALEIAADIEVDMFRGFADFSNAGVFDGNPLAMPNNLPGMHGLDPQIRISDALVTTQDLMLNEYGGDISVVINKNANLDQSSLEDLYAFSYMHNGQVETLYIDPIAKSNYNKLSIAKERIVLSGSPQHSTGSQLSQQFVGDGAINIKMSRFLSAKTNYSVAPGAPNAASVVVSESAGAGTSLLIGEVYKYYVTASNEKGEGAPLQVYSHTMAASGASVGLAITPDSAVRPTHFNVYRTAAGGKKFSLIGKIAAAGFSVVNFVDLNNKVALGTTGFAIDKRNIEIAEMQSFQSTELGQYDLTKTRAFYRFCAVVAKTPRFNMLVDNIF